MICSRPGTSVPCRRGSIATSVAPKRSTACQQTTSPPQRRLNGSLEVVGTEAIAHAGLRHEVFGILRVAFDLPAQPGDVDVQVVRFVAIVRPPDLLQEHP